MNRRAPLALLGLVAFVLVSGACRKSEAPPVALTPTAQGPLVFPPPLEGWSLRAPLPDSATAGAGSTVRLESPQVDAAGHFETSGQVIRLHFDDTVVEDLKKAPALAIAPAVKGKTVWPWGSTVEFRADAPFDPHVDYTLTLPELVTAEGRRLAGGLKLTFRAKPALELAGKTIAYLPEKGRARAVATLPLGDARIGGAQELTIVYDQPLDLALARKLVTLEDADGAPLPSTVAHLPADTLEGQRVDRRMVVVARPVEPLPPGKELVLRARAEREGDEEARRKLTVAAPTSLVAIDCGRGSDNCDVTGTRVLGPSDGYLRIQWSNPVSSFGSEKRVHITPAPKSPYVYGYDREVHVRASFEPSRTYTVRVDGGKDDFGGFVAPLTFTFETRPLPASVTMAEGPLLLDGAALRAFPVSTRNVERGELRLWALPGGDLESFKKAMRDVRSGLVPPAAPAVSVPFAPSGRRDAFTDSLLDLSGKAEPGRVYVAQVRATQTTPKALEPGASRRHADGAEVERKEVTSMLVIAAPGAVGAHVHQVGAKAVVQAYALGTGEPVAGAKVKVGAASATTDAAGTATLDVPPPGPGDDLVAQIEANGAEVMVPFGSAHAIASTALFPELAAARGGDAEAKAASTTGDLVGMLVTDRGVYKPGTKLALKGFVRRLEAAGVRPAPGAKVRLRVLDATEQQILDEAMTTGARGTLAREISLPKEAHTGRWHVRLELDGAERVVLADETVRVAAFEAPRFKVDVVEASAPAARVSAKVTGTYLFGAPMSGATVSWVLKKRRVPVNGGALGDAGLSFDDDGWWWGEDRDTEDLKPVTGEGKLDAAGSLAVDVATGPLSTRGPTEVLLEADVTDASSRHGMGSLRSVKDPVERHAGLRLSRRFGDLGPLRVELGVVDARGSAVAGEKVAARLERLTWTRTAEKAESGAIVERWTDVATRIASCEVTSAPKPVTCELPVDKEGSYRVVARVGDVDGARASFYAWGPGGRARSADDAVPSSGKKLPLVLDRTKYRAGETAVVLVQSPYDAATALLTVEQGGLLRTETKRIDGPSGTFAVPLGAASAPWVHAVVTLLPIGAAEADYRVGVTRIPVSAEGARLDVRVTSAKPTYEVKETAELTVEVKRDGAPVRNADVTLAVVDEGVLRLTSFHAKDPVPALHPGRDVAFRLVDSRGWLVRRRERAHVAGGGDGTGADELDVRKSFVETAAFLPDLVTDASGRVTAKVKLPDNLTEFRMMAIAVDDVGAGGNAESSFLVTKPVLLDPVMPRFALRGDAFEAAAIVHNTTDAALPAKVTVAGEVRDVTVPPRGRTRVGVPMKADATGTRRMLFAVEALGAVRDRVELPLRIDEPGVEEHPALSGVFLDEQEIGLAVPADAIFGDDAALSVKTGSALYPELGQRLGFLLDYPHGCVEQTSSSTIPLLAARALLPWTGTSPLSDEELERRIRLGVERLATMTTSSGGLAYWPGGHEPSTFGTAYALRVLVRARAMGIEHGKLIDQVTSFLVGALDEGDPSTRVAVAEALALAEKLPASAADALWDRRDELDAFSTASLVIALGSLPSQEDRVRELTDRLEASFDDEGAPRKKLSSEDWHSWGSGDRDRAQALIALLRHRKESKLVPVLSRRLAGGIEGYTTQSTAWSLLALADHIGSKRPEGAVDVKLRLEGRILDTTRKLGGDNKEVRIPLRELAGKKLKLLLRGDGRTPSAFALEATYKRPLAAQDGRLARRAAKGASIHRVYSDAAGKPLDLATVKAGQVVRVALRVEVAALEEHRAAYVAVTDRIPAGFEPIDPELSTSSVPDLTREHPFYDGFRTSYGAPTHVDLRDDRVQIYYDRLWSGRTLYASYVARATTPGSFALPPAHAELMYEPGSDGYSDASRVTIAP